MDLIKWNILFRYHMDPSGTFIQYDAKAIGSGSEGAQQALQDTYHKVTSHQLLWIPNGPVRN